MQNTGDNIALQMRLSVLTNYSRLFFLEATTLPDYENMPFLRDENIPKTRYGFQIADLVSFNLSFFKRALFDDFKKYLIEHEAETISTSDSIKSGISDSSKEKSLAPILDYIDFLITHIDSISDEKLLATKTLLK
ncbi:hypothetical protein SAMN05660742_1132 [Propionispira arboris]|uniref:Uncharacterized protein n=1 Tax=Propionispira arboris TaxID=84035 RepID=A0A1H7APY2_9FIRM|nr:hypothetical protein [Propionispira arboris]SEJ65907.1 hypothetical protein SAMN05660742_1132 [Propionispira arboris]